jgi:hypothetical protein
MSTAPCQTVALVGKNGIGICPVWHIDHRVEFPGGREGDRVLSVRLAADLTYLAALLGEHAPLDDYLIATQGCPAGGWTDDHVTAVGE